MNMTRVLVDTNILIYAWNSEDRIKQDKSIAAVQYYQKNIYLSIQNISEFSSVMLKNGSSPDWIKDTLIIFEKLMTVLPLSASHVRETLRAVGQYRMSYWDALIWAVAKSNSIPVILTEDGPIGQNIEGVLYKNPFLQ